MLYEVDVLASEEWKRVLSLFCKLAKFSQVYPQCYELRGIQYDLSPIAEGGFADVHKGNYRGQAVCLKIVRQFTARALRVSVAVATGWIIYLLYYTEQMYIKELALWSHLSHSNILPFYGVYSIDDSQKICLVSPWMENGNLHDYLNRTQQSPLPLVSELNRRK